MYDFVEEEEYYREKKQEHMRLIVRELLTKFQYLTNKYNENILLNEMVDQGILKRKLYDNENFQYTLTELGEEFLNIEIL